MDAMTVPSPEPNGPTPVARDDRTHSVPDVTPQTGAGTPAAALTRDGTIETSAALTETSTTRVDGGAAAGAAASDHLEDRPVHRHRRIRREVKWGVGAFVIVLLLEYLVLPELGGVSRSLHELDRVNVLYLVAGFALEAVSLVAYAQLTRTVLPPSGPTRGRVLRIELSTLALSHVAPGGTAGGAALGYRLITQEGVSGTDTGFALAMQGMGSAVVLNVIFGVALLISLFLRGYNPLYAVAAGAGVLLMATFAVAIALLTRGHGRVVDVVRRAGTSVPFIDPDRLADAVARFAERLAAFAAQRQVLRRAVGWAAANWLFDAASLWVCVAAFHTLVSPIYLLVAYGLANILAVIPITPGGLGIIEGVLVPTLVGFGVPNKSIALLAVLIYRFFNFWLPIPIGGLSYLSLRFSGEGWAQRLGHVRDEVVEPVKSDNALVAPVAEAVEVEPASAQCSHTNAVHDNAVHDSAVHDNAAVDVEQLIERSGPTSGAAAQVTRPS